MHIHPAGIYAILQFNLRNIIFIRSIIFTKVSVQKFKYCINVYAAVKHYVCIGRMIKFLMCRLKIFIRQSGYRIRITARNISVTIIREKHSCHAVFHSGIRVRKCSSHLIIYNSFVTYIAITVKFVMPAFLAEYLRSGIDKRMQHPVHIYIYKVQKIFIVPAADRKTCPVRVCHCIQKSIQRALHKFHKRLLYRIFFRAAEECMFKYMKNTAVVPRCCPECDVKCLILIFTFKPDKACA